MRGLSRMPTKYGEHFEMQCSTAVSLKLDNRLFYCYGLTLLKINKVIKHFIIWTFQHISPHLTSHTVKRSLIVQKSLLFWRIFPHRYSFWYCKTHPLHYITDIKFCEGSVEFLTIKELLSYFKSQDGFYEGLVLNNNISVFSPREQAI